MPALFPLFEFYFRLWVTVRIILLCCVQVTGAVRKHKGFSTVDVCGTEKWCSTFTAADSCGRRKLWGQTFQIKCNVAFIRMKTRLAGVKHWFETCDAINICFSCTPLNTPALCFNTNFSCVILYCSFDSFQFPFYCVKLSNCQTDGAIVGKNYFHRMF